MIGKWFGNETGAWARNVAALFFALLFWTVWTFWLLSGPLPLSTWPALLGGTAFLLWLTWGGVWCKRAACRIVTLLWIATALFFMRPFGAGMLDASLHKNGFLREQIAASRLKPGTPREAVLDFLADRGFRTVEGRSPHAVREGDGDTSFPIPQAGADVCGPYDLDVYVGWKNRRLTYLLLSRSDSAFGCRKWRVLDYPL